MHKTISKLPKKSAPVPVQKLTPESRAELESHPAYSLSASGSKYYLSGCREYLENSNPAIPRIQPGDQILMFNSLNDLNKSLAFENRYRTITDQMMYRQDAQRLSQSFFLGPIIADGGRAGVLVYDCYPVIDWRNDEGVIMRMTGNYRVLKAVPVDDNALLHGFPYRIQPYTHGPVEFTLREYGAERMYQLVCAAQYPVNTAPAYADSVIILENQILDRVIGTPKQIEAIKRTTEALYPQGKIPEITWQSYQQINGAWSSPDVEAFEKTLADGYTLLPDEESTFSTLKQAVESAMD